jgi:hypothetical protein
LLVNAPLPLPSMLWLPAMAGECDVPQHTPLAVTGALPSDVTLLLHMAPVWVMLLTESVSTVGAVRAAVVKFTWFPYPVPMLLRA